MTTTHAGLFGAAGWTMPWGGRRPEQGGVVRGVTAAAPQVARRGELRQPGNEQSADGKRDSGSGASIRSSASIAGHSADKGIGHRREGCGCLEGDAPEDLAGIPEADEPIPTNLGKGILTLPHLTPGPRSITMVAEICTRGFWLVPVLALVAGCEDSPSRMQRLLDKDRFDAPA